MCSYLKGTTYCKSSFAVSPSGAEAPLNFYPCLANSFFMGGGNDIKDRGNKIFKETFFLSTCMCSRKVCLNIKDKHC